ncbi:hypothetical protein PUV54_12475 [Hyphococcus flavus]|uniref:Nuclear transport factor 2 family protein n=1 Tax=Hyphococcus flavus TaxID=1866326 RepID=A0AAE9ZDQ2_9PROT|nr:hypothetical protein [Hyphococcus flavus]WDI30768.1 hypothetical protein PUV54_12475 [Hyphococcus flavus]
MSIKNSMNYHSIDDVITAMYAAISGEPGKQDWALSRSLFHEKARLVRTRLDDAGKPIALSFDVDEYQANAKELLKDIPFHEIEIARQTERFGNIANVFSAYEARTAPDAPDLIKRGMNIIQLYDDGSRWWIMHMIWDDEREGLKLPTHIFSASAHA